MKRLELLKKVAAAARVVVGGETGEELLRSLSLESTLEPEALDLERRGEGDDVAA